MPGRPERTAPRRPGAFGVRPYQSLLRELLEAQRNRKSEQLSKETSRAKPWAAGWRSARNCSILCTS
jgi:hypothetical protein